MTGRELIKLIQDNHAEDMPVLVQYRDAEGDYPGGEEARFHMAKGRMQDGNYAYEWDIIYRGGLEPNVIVL